MESLRITFHPTSDTKCLRPSVRGRVREAIAPDGLGGCQQCMAREAIAPECPGTLSSLSSLSKVLTRMVRAPTRY
jgi:hypothetical protein